MNDKGHETKQQKRGIVIFDVDGVIFPGQFIMFLARKKGLVEYALTIVDCLAFNLGRMSLETLMDRAFARFRGMPWEQVRDTYRSMPLTQGTKEAIAELRGAGYRIVLLSSGAPDELVKELAARIGADDAVGVEVGIADGKLTGVARGELTKTGGKLSCAERLLAQTETDWEDTAVIGDDPNNLPLMVRAGVSVGFRATYSVRRRADFLAESGDLREAAAFIQEKNPRPLLHLRWRRIWAHEIFRKAIHLLGAFVPFFAARWPVEISVVFICAMAVYLILEFWRLNGVSLPLIQPVGRIARRQHESRESAIAPLTLALGMLFALWCLPSKIGLPCILIAAVADSAAAIIGTRWGRVRWPYNGAKTLEGSAVFLICALMCALVYLPAPKAFILAAIAAFIESLPLQDWDNFAVPAVSGLVAAMLII